MIRESPADLVAPMIAGRVSELIGAATATPRHVEALRDFFSVYDANFEATVRATYDEIRDHPELGRFMRMFSAEQLAARSGRTREAARGAILDGNWGPYLAYLREQGETYAAFGLSFSSWFESIATWRRYLLPLIISTFSADSARARSAVEGMERFADIAMSVIGEQYIAAKHAAAERRRAEAEALAEAARLLTRAVLASDGLTALLDAARSVVPTAVMALVVPHDDGATLECAAISGGRAEFVGRRYSVTEGITGRAFRSGQMQLVEDVRSDPDYSEWMPGVVSELVVPLVVDNEVLGLIDLEATAEGAFGRREQELIASFAAHAAVALKSRRLVADLAEQHAVMRSILQVADGIYALDRAGRVTFVNPTAERVLGWSESDLLGRPMHDVVHFKRADGTVVAREDCPLRAAIRAGQAMTVDDDVFVRRDGSTLPVAYTSSPIVRDGAVAGSVTAFHDMSRTKELIREADARRAEAEALAEAARVVAAGTITGDTLEAVLAATQRVVPVNHAMLVVPRPEDASLEVVAVVGAPQAWVGRRYPAESGITGRALRTGRTERVDDVRQDPDYREWVPGMRSELATPIVLKDEVVGVINLESDMPSAFGPREEQLMESFAHHAAIAFENHRLITTATDRARQLNAVVEGALDAVAVTDAEGRILDWNAQATQTFGWAREEAIGRAFAELVIAARYREMHERARRRFLELGEPTIFRQRIEIDAVRRSGEEFPAEMAVSPVALDGRHLFSVFLREISERKRAEAELQRLALTDPLTALPNRAAIQGEVEIAILAGHRVTRAFTLFYIDLDGFQEINNTFGYDGGDAVLREVARRLLDLVQPQDMAARVGSDHFAVLARSVTGAGAAALTAELLRDRLRAPYLIAEEQVFVEAICGSALYPTDGDQTVLLLRRAELAAIAAKKVRAGYLPFAPDHEPQGRKVLAVLADLRRGLDDQLVLHYQPKVDLETGRLVGAEALVRWQHPTRGLLGPADFVPAAEQGGLIRELTLRVLRLAMRDAVAWQREGVRIPVAVNLSAENFHDPQIREIIQHLLTRCGVAPQLLLLEITETAIMSDAGRARETLSALKADGLSVAIDDFGTGYSSLAYLRDLPVDELKIDRAFIARMASDTRDVAIVRSVIELAHNLGLTVVAEGVGDAPTLDLLKTMRCDVAQGFHIAQPMAADDLLRFARSGANTTLGL